MSKQSIYIKRPVINTSDIMNYAKSIGLKSIVEPETLHVTICASNEPVNWDTLKKSLDETVEIDCQIKHGVLMQLGEATVIKLFSLNLYRRWVDLTIQGCKWAFPEYIPHITLSYDCDINIDNVPPFEGNIILGEETWEEFVEVDNPEEIIL